MKLAGLFPAVLAVATGPGSQIAANSITLGQSQILAVRL